MDTKASTLDPALFVFSMNLSPTRLAPVKSVLSQYGPSGLGGC
jgi:hypothetical protein